MELLSGYDKLLNNSVQSQSFQLLCISKSFLLLFIFLKEGLLRLNRARALKKA